MILLNGKTAYKFLRLFYDLENFEKVFDTNFLPHENEFLHLAPCFASSNTLLFFENWQLGKLEIKKISVWILTRIVSG